MNKLKCEYCKKEIDSTSPAKVCVDCGHIMRKVPLIYGEFEKVTDDYEIPKKEKK